MNVKWSIKVRRYQPHMMVSCIYIGTLANAHALQSNTHENTTTESGPSRFLLWGKRSHLLRCHANCSIHLKHTIKATAQLQRFVQVLSLNTAECFSSTLVAPVLKRSVALGCSPMQDWSRLNRSCLVVRLARQPTARSYYRLNKVVRLVCQAGTQYNDIRNKTYKLEH